jgi:hypothetical protein
MDRKKSIMDRKLKKILNHVFVKTVRNEIQWSMGQGEVIYYQFQSGCKIIVRREEIGDSIVRQNYLLSVDKEGFSITFINTSSPEVDDETYLLIKTLYETTRAQIYDADKMFDAILKDLNEMEEK